MVENKDFILKGIVFVIHKFTDLYCKQSKIGS